MSTNSPNPSPTSGNGTSQQLLNPPTVSDTPLATQQLNLLSTNDHGERYWLILQNNVEWLRFSETKAGLIITCYGVLYTIIYTNAKDVFSSVADPGIVKWLVVLFGTASLVSITSAFLAIRPRLRNNNPTSILYFRHIKKRFPNAATYKQAAHTILDDKDKYADHLTEQIHSIAKVADSKFVCTGVSIWAFAISMVALVVAVLVYVNQNLPHSN